MTRRHMSARISTRTRELTLRAVDGTGARAGDWANEHDRARVTSIATDMALEGQYLTSDVM